MLKTVTMLALLALSTCSASSAFARDPTGYWAREHAAGNAPGKEWWDQLASGKGLCCDFADGKRVDDVDWESVDGHYRVRLNGQWLSVPDDAVVTAPNKYGPAVVWPWEYGGVVQIRCFLPGAGT